MTQLNFDEITSTIVKTNGFMALDVIKQDEIMNLALQEINPLTDFIVFKRECEEKHLEDENRTLIIPYDVEKVYVKLDDYKGNEKENLGKRFVITFMLAEEY